MSELNDLTTEPMAELSSLEHSPKDVTRFRLDEINKIKDYLNAEIKERKDIVKKISKYIVAIDYAAGASLTVIFTVTTGIVKKILNITRKKKKKHNKIITLAKNKLNIIENLISQALIDFYISHEEFSKIIYEKNNYEQMKNNIRSAKSINDLNKEND